MLRTYLPQLLFLPILLASLVATTLILERLLFWISFWLKKNPRLRQRLLETSPGAGEEFLFQDPVARVLWIYHTQGLSQAKLAAEEVIQQSQTYLPTLRLIGSISTSLGLLGTVVGVSMSFRSLALTDSKGIAEGLGTALYTTIFGLVIFLYVSLWLHFFHFLSQNLTKTLERYLFELHWEHRPSQTSYSHQEFSPSLFPFVVTAAFLSFLGGYFLAPSPWIYPLLGFLTGLFLPYFHLSLSEVSRKSLTIFLFLCISHLLGAIIPLWQANSLPFSEFLPFLATKISYLFPLSHWIWLGFGAILASLLPLGIESFRRLAQENSS